MTDQQNVNQLPSKFHQNISDYDAEVLITIQSKNRSLRRLIMDSIFLDHQNGKLYYEGASQDPDSTSFLRRVLVRMVKE